MLKVLEHPLITHKLAQLRRKETGTKDFRHLSNEISGLMAFEISGDLPVKKVIVEKEVNFIVTTVINYIIDITGWKCCYWNINLANAC